MKTKERKKGISLIVLIITIVVMIIIAAAIILNIDDTKIIRNAEKAATNNNMAVANEIRVAARAEWRINESKLREEGYNSYRQYLISKLEAANIKLGNNAGEVEVSANGELYLYAEPVIPEGYIASNKTSEDEVSEGLVIYEGDETVSTDEDAMTTRNQYVWIPVPNINDFVLKDWSSHNSFSYNAFINNSIESVASYLLSESTEAAEYNEMIKSVEKYGGFYIARYEAGNNGTGKAVSMQNVTPYIRVSFAGAKSLASLASTENAVGHLIYGEEWDAALSFILKKDPFYVSNPDGKGWLDALTHNTGADMDANASNMICNIYDMCGNMLEWSMETNKDNGAGVLRSSKGSMKNPALRNSLMRGNASDGFRVALYIK